MPTTRNPATRELSDIFNKEKFTNIGVLNHYTGDPEAPQENDGWLTIEDGTWVLRKYDGNNWVLGAMSAASQTIFMENLGIGDSGGRLTWKNKKDEYDYFPVQYRFTTTDGLAKHPVVELIETESYLYTHEIETTQIDGTTITFSYSPPDNGYVSAFRFKAGSIVPSENINIKMYQNTDATNPDKLVLDQWIDYKTISSNSYFDLILNHKIGYDANDTFYHVMTCGESFSLMGNDSNVPYVRANVNSYVDKYFSYEPEYKDGSFTAHQSGKYMLDTSSGPATVTVPSGVTYIEVYDAAGQFAPNNCTVSFTGYANNFVANVLKRGYIFYKYNTTWYYWSITNGDGGVV